VQSEAAKAAGLPVEKVIVNKVVAAGGPASGPGPPVVGGVAAPPPVPLAMFGVAVTGMAEATIVLDQLARVIGLRIVEQRD
jgi:hypothetical protein